MAKSKKAYYNVIVKRNGFKRSESQNINIGGKTIQLQVKRPIKH